MISLVGILNCTPDSFSDGDPAATESTLYDRAQALIDEGAHMLDIGGDSTRPGSVCVSDEEEWRRIGALTRRLAHRIPLSIDTHKASIARRAIACGVAMINDVGGGRDEELLNVVAKSDVLYVCMYNAHPSAHALLSQPSSLTPDTCVPLLTAWVHDTTARLTAAGIPVERQVIDTGMGAFLSSDPAVSLEVIKRYWEIPTPSKRRMFGCSRKGFMRQPTERSAADRDPLTATYCAQIAAGRPRDTTMYLRVHSVRLTRIACGDGGISD